ncbi:hypothetical protein [Rufibacter hautae]|uniref:Uncharacterized protein n=1 Tax=Rufibacter hautae TaxID=2595005 RepID=A0A5B6TK64_9BACT|nr:hypothetical protein [Rufibacter hautae]KAA3439777.1 hypothetical protein FOA19_03625 [Rufibacter hautae]
MEAEIQKFKLKGRVYLWKYKELENRYPGWNLATDADGCDSLVKLLNLMDTSELPSKKTVPTEVPTKLQLKVPNYQQGLASWRAAKYLTLNFKKQGQISEWNITENGEEVEVRFGVGKLNQLRTAIAGIPQGKGDFAISDSDEENILYFWWNLEN